MDANFPRAAFGLGLFVFLSALLAGCASPPARPIVTARPVHAAAAPSAPVPASAPKRRNHKALSPRQKVVANALRELGRPYVYGGEGPHGFDCSGLVQFAYARAGIHVPRTTRALIRAGHRIPLSAARPGDLIFFRIRTHTGDLHVGIYLGNGHMVHASSGTDRVRVARITKRYWRRHYLETIRFLPI